MYGCSRLLLLLLLLLLLQLICHSVAVVLTLVQTKPKRNNTKNTVQPIQNTVNTGTHITKTLTHHKTHIIKKKVKTNTVQDVHK